MNKIAAYDLVLEDHPLWEKVAGREANWIRKAPIGDLRKYLDRAMAPGGNFFAEGAREGFRMKKSFSPSDREYLIHILRKNRANPSARLEPRTKRDVGFAKKYRSGDYDPEDTIRLSHGATKEDLANLLRDGPTSHLDHAVSVPSGRKTKQGLYTHEVGSRGDVQRRDFYAGRRAGQAGGTPAIVEFDFPRGLLSDPNRVGAVEHGIPRELWKHVSNVKVVEPQNKRIVDSMQSATPGSRMEFGKETWQAGLPSKSPFSRG